MIAAGAIERPLIIPDNDRPGVMSADAALVYLKRFGVLVGKRVVVATNNDSAYAVAEALAEAGAEVEIVDTRASGLASTLRVTHGAAIEGVVGSRSVEAVRIRGRTQRLRRSAALGRVVADGASLRAGARTPAL